MAEAPCDGGHWFVDVVLGAERLLEVEEPIDEVHSSEAVVLYVEVM